MYIWKLTSLHFLPAETGQSRNTVPFYTDVYVSVEGGFISELNGWQYNMSMVGQKLAMLIITEKMGLMNVKMRAVEFFDWGSNQEYKEIDDWKI